MENMEEISWIVKRFGYRRNVSWIVKRCGKYGRKVSWRKIWKKGKLNCEKDMEKNVGWIVKWYGKYGRKASWMWKDRENMEESQVE